MKNDEWVGCGCIGAAIVLGLALSIGLCVGGAYLIIAAANVLFNAGWPYDTRHVVVIAGILFFLGLLFGGGSRSSFHSSRKE